MTIVNIIIIVAYSESSAVSKGESSYCDLLGYDIVYYGTWVRAFQNNTRPASFGYSRFPQQRIFEKKKLLSPIKLVHRSSE